VITNPGRLFIDLFKAFIANDIFGAHIDVEALLYDLYSLGIPDDKKAAFHVELVNEFLI